MSLGSSNIKHGGLTRWSTQEQAYIHNPSLYVNMQLRLFRCERFARPIVGEEVTKVFT